MKEISIQQLNELMNYLATKPFMEVVGFMNMLGTLKDVEKPKFVPEIKKEVDKK